jgi:hypothetical protein
MQKALFLHWLRWALWVTLFSVVVAALLSLGVTLYIYFAKGAVPLNAQVTAALLEIALFWFAIFWSVTLPIGTFFGMKQLFKHCSNTMRLRLFTCSKEPVETPHYKDVLKIWRKWLFLMIWGVAVAFIVIIGVEYIMHSETFLSWFNIYFLYLMLMFSSWVTLKILIKKCRLIEVRPC